MFFLLEIMFYFLLITLLWLCCLNWSHGNGLMLKISVQAVCLFMYLFMHSLNFTYLFIFNWHSTHFPWGDYVNVYFVFNVVYIFPHTSSVRNMKQILWSRQEMTKAVIIIYLFFLNSCNLCWLKYYNIT